MTEIKLDDHFSAGVNDELWEVKMSFGLLNELVRTVGDIEAVTEISFDIELRDALMIQIFSERDAKGRIKEDVNLFNLDIKPDTVVDLLDWVGSHVTDFLLKQMLRSKEMMESRQDQIMALTPSSTGSQA
jgi:hypothetical protein